MWKYLGHGEFIAGVPARDLSDEEAKQFPEIAVSSIYVHEVDEKPVQAGVTKGKRSRSDG